MNSLVFSGFVAHYLVTHNLASGGLAYGIVAAWVAWIGLARLYMGLHTCVDILAGFIAGVILLVSWIRYAGAPS
jgi:membrane-associated phospholipid phosphatase